MKKILAIKIPQECRPKKIFQKFRLRFNSKCSPNLNSIGKLPGHKFRFGSGTVFSENVNTIFSIKPTRLGALIVVSRTPGGRR